MSRIIFYVGKNTETQNCLDLYQGREYLDTIYRNRNYINELATVKVRVYNNCSDNQFLDSRVIFSDIENGGTFEAIISEGIVPANTYREFDVVYKGVYKGSSNTPNYTFDLGNNSNIYKLKILDEDNPPFSEHVSYVVSNRTVKTINKDSLIFGDIDGDNVTHVRFNGDVSRLYLNESLTIPYTINTPLDVNSFTLFVRPPNTNNTTTYLTKYDVKSNDLWSN